MKNIFWGDIAEIITVRDDIPDKNLAILRKLHPNAEIIKESTNNFTEVVKVSISEVLYSNSYDCFSENDYETVLANYEIAA